MSGSSRLRRGTVEFRGETFQVREWTSAERALALEAREAQPRLFSANVASLCTLAADGSRVWDSQEAAANEPPELTDALCAKVLMLSGIDLEGAEKNA